MENKKSIFSQHIVIGALFLAVLAAGAWYVASKRLILSSKNIGSLNHIFSKENLVPIVVVGSGPAGYSAALYGARSGFYTIVIEGKTPGGQLMKTSYVENWPGLPKKLGPDLMKSMREQAQEFGVVMVTDVVKSIDTSHWPYVVTTENGLKLHALTIVLAVGSSAKLLTVRGADEYFGWDKGIGTCAICDAPFYKNKEVFVVGGGDSAAEEAMQLAPYAKKITLLVRGDRMRASAVMQDRLKTYAHIDIKYNTEIKEIKGDGKHVTEVILTTKDKEETAKIDGIFLALGHYPNSDIAKGVVAMDEGGHILVQDRTQKTSVPGIFAAGDVVDFKYRQAGVSSGDGIKAGLDAAEFLRMQGYNDAIASKVQDRLFIYEGGVGRKALTQLKTMEEVKNLVDKSDLPVLIDFYSTVCPTCEQMLPVLEIMAGEFEGRINFYKADINHLPDLVEKYTIEGVPSFILTKKGSLVARAAKTMSIKEMKEFLEAGIK